MRFRCNSRQIRERLLFSDDGASFLRYGISGRSWIAIGGAVGAAPVQREIAWRFRELAARHGGDAVFYLASPSQLPAYLEMGLRLLKIGEAARLPLHSFAIDDEANAWLRRSREAAMDAGCTFSVLLPEDIGAEVRQIGRVSDAWLSSRHLHGKRFSLGAFDDTGVGRTALAVVRCNDELVGFATIRQGAVEGELSIDLPRYGRKAPHGVTNYLYAEILQWGQEHRHVAVDLGIAPLSGLQERPNAPLWQRAGATIFRRASALHDFVEVRRYLEQFRPQWEPRYLATPGGMVVPRTLANLASLIGRGLVAA